MIIAELVGKRLQEIGGSLRQLELVFEGDISLIVYPYIKRAGTPPEISWTITVKEKESKRP